MEKGFENKPRETKTGPTDTEMIKSLKKGISQIEEELKKDNNTTDDILNLETALTDLKTKLAKAGGIKPEDSLEDYSSTLEEVAYNRELDRLNQEIRDILDQIKKTKVERGVLDYFNKEIDISLLEKDISLLENKIKQGLQADSKIPSSMLDKMASTIKLYKESLDQQKKDVSNRFNTDINVARTLEDIEKARKKTDDILIKIKELEELHERYEAEEKNKDDKNFSLN